MSTTDPRYTPKPKAPASIPGSVYTNRGICFRHYKLGAGHITLAYRAVPTTNTNLLSATRIDYGVSFCSPAEVSFDKRKGRDIAVGRLDQASLRLPTGDTRRAERAFVKALPALLPMLPGYPKGTSTRPGWAFGHDPVRRESSLAATVAALWDRVP